MNDLPRVIDPRLDAERAAAKQSGARSGRDLAREIDELRRYEAPLDLTRKIKVRENGALQGSRSDINFIEGTNIALTVDDNPAAKRVDVTIDASSFSLTVQEGDGTVATDVFELTRATTTPPAGAGPPNWTVPVDVVWFAIE